MITKDTDKFLLAIVAGVVLLVAAAFVIVLRRPAPAYLSDNTPAAIAHNYLLALEQEDYPRAYAYLSPNLRGYPTNAERFADDVARNRWNFGGGGASTTWSVESSRVNADRATVSVRETRFYSGGLFGGSEHKNVFELRLKQEQGAWKITGADSYWLACWDQARGCD